MQLHERLRELRSERKLRLIDVSERSGVSVPYLSDLERGRTNPSLETLQTLAGAYSLTVQDVLHGVEWYGDGSVEALPRGLQDLMDDPALGVQITPDWAKTLARIELRGKRPRDKGEWYEVFLYLRRIME